SAPCRTLAPVRELDLHRAGNITTMARAYHPSAAASKLIGPSRPRRWVPRTNEPFERPIGVRGALAVVQNEIRSGGAAVQPGMRFMHRIHWAETSTSLTFAA